MNKNIFIILILSLVLTGFANAAIPPDPVNLTSDTSQSGHVVWSWAADTGNITDSYNVSIDSIWHNGSSSTSYDDNVGSGVTSTITVWAYNSTATAALSSGNVTGSQKGVFTFSSINDVIEGIIPIFSSIVDLMIAIIPLTIMIIFLSWITLLFSKAFKKGLIK